MRKGGSMEKRQSVFYINIIAGYLEKFVVGKMKETVYFSKSMIFRKNERLYNIDEADQTIDFVNAVNQYGLPVKFLGLLWTDEKDKFLKYDKCFLNQLTDEGNIIIKFGEEEIHVKVWKCTLESNDNYLLDCNIEENPVHIRNITIYNHKDIEKNKFMSDVIISIGGIEALRYLGVKNELFHFNGEYCILAINRILQNEMKEHPDKEWEEVIEDIRSRCFTTIHNLNVKNYTSNQLSEIFQDKDLKEFKYRISRSNNIYTNILINNKKSNATSIMHGENLRRKIENDKIKDKLVNIVNGVHIQEHIKKDILAAFKNGKKIYKAHLGLKQKFIKYIYSKTFVKLKEDKIVIGVIATSNEYERWNLLLRDKEKLYNLLENHGVQIVFYVQASKSSKADINFKKYLSLKKRFPQNIIFLNDLDRKLYKKMINGCDIILNTSKIPQDPCGVYRIKAAINGVLNFSTLNGCWPEVCVEGINGWQIGSGVRFKDTREQDKHDLKSLYDILENKVLVTYEDKEKWEDMILQSMKSTMEYFCMERIIIEYFDNMYK